MLCCDINHPWKKRIAYDTRKFYTFTVIILLDEIGEIDGSDFTESFHVMVHVGSTVVV